LKISAKPSGWNSDLQPERLSEGVSKAALEAKALQDTFNAFGHGFEKGWRDVMRRSAIEELERTFQKVMKEVEKEDQDIAQFLALYGDKEVWVCAACHRGACSLSASKMKRESAPYVSAIMRGKGVIYLSVETLSNVIFELKTLILEGRLDESIHLTAERLIYDRMSGMRLMQ